MKVIGVHHVVLAVKELEPPAAAWKQVFGLEAEPTIHPVGMQMEIALMPAGNAYLELVRPTTDDHRVSRFIADRSEGMYSISFEVDDLDAAVSALRDKGVNVSNPVVGPLPNTRIARIPSEDAHGVPQQLIERTQP